MWVLVDIEGGADCYTVKPAELTKGFSSRNVNPKHEKEAADGENLN